MKIWSGFDVNQNEISKDLKQNDINFKNVLEDNIKEIVLFFSSKNFKTISSCAGHSLYESAHLTFVSPSLNVFYSLKNLTKYFLGINIFVRNYCDFGNVKNTRLGPVKFVPSKEIYTTKMRNFTETDWDNYYPIEITFGYKIFPETSNKIILCFYNIFLKKIMMYLFLLFLKFNLKNFYYYLK